MFKLIKFGFYLFLAASYLWATSVFWVFHGPFPALKKNIVGMVSTSHHPQYLQPLALYTLTPEELKQEAPQALSAQEGGLRQEAPGNFQNVSDPSIQVEDYKGAAFSAKVMLVRDPKRVKAAVTKHIGEVGQTVGEMVDEAKAVAGVNGGSFKDVGWRGTGGEPLGFTMHDGKIYAKGGGQSVVALTKSGALVVGAYSEEELAKMSVTEGVTFGPALVQNGKGLISGDGGWGLAPRTAIGQKADGTIIMMVTDGRFVHGPDNLGASLRDIQNLMLKYGAVTAGNLDGGSSTTMYNNGKLINDPSDVLGERKVATAFVVMPAKGGTEK